MQTVKYTNKYKAHVADRPSLSRKSNLGKGEDSFSPSGSVQVVAFVHYWGASEGGAGQGYVPGRPSERALCNVEVLIV